ncbi:chorismate mutase [Candidatus Woesearchaeota archaeon]|nr:chorismate mutase [Candidatus Woesearchaeota archaeon]
MDIRNISLERIVEVVAAELRDQEDTIIRALMERVKFPINSAIYTPGQSGRLEEERKSYMETILHIIEQAYQATGRYNVPEERPFNADLVPEILKDKRMNTGLASMDPNAINLTSEIKSAYLELIRNICRAGDAPNDYGSSAVKDVDALQAISLRVHTGIYVAEGKYQQDPRGYSDLIHAQNRDGLMAKLTVRPREQDILRRVRKKAKREQRKVYTSWRERLEDIKRHLKRQEDPYARTHIGPRAIMEFYRDTIIPLTKEGEVKYLLQRPI